MKKTALAVLVVLAGCAQEASVDEGGSPDVTGVEQGLRAPTLDITSWNLEWFGSTVHGPTDEALQKQNVLTVLGHLPSGIFGLCEVVSTPTMHDVAGLLGYGVVVANDESVVDGSLFYGSSEQKVALMYPPLVATVTHAELILTESSTDFGGRPPLHVDLDLKAGGKVGFVVVHFKAFADADSYARRTRAATALEAWLKTRPRGELLAVIGDWNDGLDVSIYDHHATPFASIEADAPHLAFTTAQLLNRGLSSTVRGNTVIDNHLLTDAMRRGVTETAELVRADAWVKRYGDNTSDHYPVTTHLRFGQPRAVIDAVQTGANGYVRLANPSSKTLKLDGWKLGDADAVRFDFTTQTIAPHGTLIVRGALALDDSGDAVTLSDDAFTVVDQVTFGPTGGTLLQRATPGNASTPLE